ncbi:O-antigen ligase family protein [Aurantiacibacter gilvus]|uniref:O-antigen ligase family protein n=1 Tax=Aurantiacibacter gilvus TaxID=3139141 RepID=A0ABU9IGH4_9SPHN
MPNSTTMEGQPRDAAAFDLALFYAVCAFTALLGGSSRYDLMQIPMLQAGLWAMLAVAIVRMRGVPFARGLLVLAVVYAGWLVLQVIPLPHSLWIMLPGREALENVETALGSHHARPFSMAPSRTLNALGGFAAVLAPLVAAINLGRSAPKQIVIVLIAIAAVSSVLALSQVQLGSPYLYSITNTGKPVGLFANSNHFAVCTAVMIVVLGYVGRFAAPKLQPAAAILALLLVVSVLLGPSRAGLLTLVVAIMALGLFMVQNLPAEKLLGGRVRASTLVGVAGAGGLVVLVLAMANSDQVPALDRLLASDTFEDMRFAILPTLLEMIGEFAPFGSGTGSFENVYYMFETRENMEASYVNMAHNDLLQVLIEGGAVVLGFILTAAVIVYRTVMSLLRRHEAPRPLLICVAAITLIVVMASAADYPLRAPLFQANITLLLVALSALAAKARQEAQGARKQGGWQ